MVFSLGCVLEMRSPIEEKRGRDNALKFLFENFIHAASEFHSYSHLHTACPLLTSPRSSPHHLSQIHTPPPLENHLLIPSVMTTFIWVWTIHWSTVNSPWTTSLNKAGFLSFRSYHLSIAPQPEVKSSCVPTHPCWDVNWLSLVQFLCR